MLSRIFRSAHPTPCSSTLLHPSCSPLRYASVKAGIARGLRASGVELSNPRKSKRTKPRRGPNTGALGQKRVAEKKAKAAAPTAKPQTRESSEAERQPPRIPYPFPVPYTTATSVFVPGRRAIESILLANRRTIYKIYIAKQSRSSIATRQLESEARKRRVVVELKSQEWIDRALGALKMDGVVNDGCLVECSEFVYTPLEHLSDPHSAKRSFEYVAQNERRPQTLMRDLEGSDWRAPFLLWLHEVVDTGNIAALYRSAIYFGVDAVILTERGTGRMQPKTLRASAGSAEFLPTFTVANTGEFLKKSKARGWQFLGAMPPAKDRKTSKKIDVSVMEHSPVEKQPCVLVLGNESQGLSKDIKEACDASITIPAAGRRAMQAGVDSLNVSSAGTLLFSRLLQRSDTKKEGHEVHETGVSLSEDKRRVF